MAAVERLPGTAPVASALYRDYSRPSDIRKQPRTRL